MINYLHRVGIALSILFNVVAGGYPHQTFSARNYQWQRDHKPNLVFLINFLMHDPNHCLEDWVNWHCIKDTLDKYGCRK